MLRRLCSISWHYRKLKQKLYVRNIENASIKIKDCKIILSVASKGNDGSDIETDITIGEIKDGEN